MTRKLFQKRIFPAAILLFITTGCVHDMYYVSAKDRRYESPAFTDAKITEDSWVDPADHTSAVYTSSTMVVKERYRSALLGNLYLKASDDPDEEATNIAIRKEHHSYMAEAPAFSPFRVGDKKVYSNFSLGKHKDHKVMAGLMFRMPF